MCSKEKLFSRRAGVPPAKVKDPNLVKGEIIEAIATPVFFVILNVVKDLKPLKIRDSSLRSE